MMVCWYVLWVCRMPLPKSLIDIITLLSSLSSKPHHYQKLRRVWINIWNMMTCHNLDRQRWLNLPISPKYTGAREGVEGGSSFVRTGYTPCNWCTSTIIRCVSTISWTVSTGYKPCSCLGLPTCTLAHSAWTVLIKHYHWRGIVLLYTYFVPILAW